MTSPRSAVRSHHHLNYLAHGRIIVKKRKKKNEEAAASLACICTEKGPASCYYNICGVGEGKLWLLDEEACMHG